MPPAAAVSYGDLAQAMTRETPPTTEPELPAPSSSSGARAAAVVVALSICLVVGLSLWFLVQPDPLLVQGEADARRLDIAARVDGRISTRPADRGADMAQGAALVTIDNPQLLARLAEARAAKVVAEADLERIRVGTRAEVIAARKAAVAAADASAKLAQQTYDRTRQLTERDFASVQKLDEATASLDVARRALDQARLAQDEAIAGYTAEERAWRRPRSPRPTPPSGPAGAGRRTRGEGARRHAGLSGQCRARRICLARRAAALAGGPLGRLGAVRPAGGPDRRPQAGRPLHRAHPGPRRQAGDGGGAHHRDARRICRLAGDPRPAISI